MALFGRSLDAVNSTGPGAALMFDTPKNAWCMQFAVVGSDFVILDVEATIDGVNFQSISHYGVVPTTNRLHGAGPESGFVFLGLRANLYSMDSPSTAFSVTVDLAVK